jgi:hypothetical protein
MLKHWFSRVCSPPVQTLSVGSVQFLREQDGPSERLLKARLTTILRQARQIQRAYLVRARLQGSDGDSIVLALRTDQPLDAKMISALGTEFGELFERGEALDIVSIDSAREDQIRGMAVAFFQQQPFN